MGKPAAASLIPYVSYILDTALSPDHKLHDIGIGTFLVGWQAGFEPLVVAVTAGYTEAIDESDAEEIAADYLREIKWSDDLQDADYVVKVTKSSEGAVKRAINDRLHEQGESVGKNPRDRFEIKAAQYARRLKSGQWPSDTCQECAGRLCCKRDWHHSGDVCSHCGQDEREDGKMKFRKNAKAALHCGRCNATSGACAECGEVYQHGTVSHCTSTICRDVNAPIDCACGFVVSEGLDGVLNYDMKLIPWKESRRATKNPPYEELVGGLDDAIALLLHYEGMKKSDLQKIESGRETLWALYPGSFVSKLPNTRNMENPYKVFSRGKMVAVLFKD
jgi:hypothetical protein